ncbi:hypothetical protein [Geomesophilobacter sediminis]|uniref:Uncharacterized protein n=1 Tax=Geomesophilobacter sediminis TaxID=2798584 RepID=A0A8J7M0P9_9BACT|nr:hypothetical protein [Geomesophilobacter sediminis]MBJ6726327.1 hypothetical protein [Geomesophilobacter sediminis]
MAEWWSVVTLVGLWGWILSAVGFILRGFPRRGTFCGGRALPFGVALVIFFILWMVGMSHA